MDLKEYYESDNRDHMANYATGHYLERNTRQAEMISKHHFSSVIELGGSEGGLCGIVASQNPGIRYHITDLTDAAVSYYKTKFGNSENVTYSKLDADADHIDWSNYDAFFCNSLEHFKHDLRVIKQIPKGTLVSICLPNFQCVGHYRTFSCTDDIIDRYGDHIDFIEMEMVSVPPTRFTWLKNAFVKSFVFDIVNWCMFHMCGGTVAPMVTRRKWICVGRKR